MDETKPLGAPLTMPDGFVAFYRRESELVLRFCARGVLDAEAALDLCAETFAQAFRGRRGFRGSTEAEARAWILTIARRQVARYLKQGVLDRCARNALGLQTPALAPDDVQEIERLAGLEALREALAEELGRLGKFHERGAQVLDPTNRQQLDAVGNTFIAVNYLGIPDSADGRACAARKLGGDRRPLCPNGSLRNVAYGLLGPQAVAIAYAGTNGRTMRHAVAGPEGAYVVVVATGPAHRGVGQWSASSTPAGGLRSVEYRDGTVCRIADLRRINGVRRCPLKGYVTPKLAPVTRAQLTTRIQVAVGTRREHPGPKVKDGAFPAQRRITLHFRARVAGDARSFYTYGTTWKGHPPEGCANSGGPIARDVKAGTLVSTMLYVPFKCHGTMRVAVGFAQHRKPGRVPFDVGRFGRAEVGATTIRL
jgi:sigma-70-like protein